MPLNNFVPFVSLPCSLSLFGWSRSVRHSTILLLQMGRVSLRCNSLCYHHMGFGSPAAHNTCLVGHLPQCFQGFSPFRTPMITSQTANTLYCLVFFLLRSLLKCPWIPHTKQFPYFCLFLRSGFTANAAEHLCPFCLFAVLVVAFWVVTLCASFHYSFVTDGPRFSSLQ